MDDERNSICSNIFSAIQDNMKNLYAPEIFSKSSFEELGAFYYGALIDTVEGATTELINAVVATLKKNSKFEEQEEYYKNLCYILGFKLLPKEAYDWVQNKYDDLFVVRWNSIIQKYEAEIANLGCELFQTKCESDKVKKKGASFSIIRDISEDEEQLYCLSSKCNSLRTRKEMLEHAFQYVQSVLGEFCDLQDAAEVDFSIRKTALSFSKEENKIIRDSYFDVYKTCLEIFEDDIERDYMLFFKVKIYTAVGKANKKYHEDFYKLKEEEAVEAYGRYYSNPSTLNDEIFAKELMLDLCLLVHMFVRTSETERMYRFVHGYQAYYQKLIKSSEHPSFGALFNDIIGQKIVSEYDGIRKYRPIQVAYWLVNPYYEKIYEQVEDKSDLLSLRDEFLSKEFWEYVYQRLSEVERQGYDYLNINTEFSSVIKSLFRCSISNETKQVLGKVNALANKIIAL